MKKERALRILAFAPLYALGFILASFIAVFVSKGLGDYGIYKSHSWIETEARFAGSEEYKTTEKVGVHRKGRTRSSVTVIRYRWEYRYEINGTEHSFIIDKRKESSPERTTKNIIVAEDDSSVYLAYKNGGALKAMLIIFPLVGLVMFSAVLAAIIALGKRLRKLSEV